MQINSIRAGGQGAEGHVHHGRGSAIDDVCQRVLHRANGRAGANVNVLRLGTARRFAGHFDDNLRLVAHCCEGCCAGYAGVVLGSQRYRHRPALRGGGAHQGQDQEEGEGQAKSGFRSVMRNATLGSPPGVLGR